MSNPYRDAKGRFASKGSGSKSSKRNPLASLRPVGNVVPRPRVYTMAYPITSKPKPPMHRPIEGRYASMRGVVGKPIKGGLGIGLDSPKKKRKRK